MSVFRKLKVQKNLDRNEEMRLQSATFMFYYVSDASLPVYKTYLTIIL